MDDLFERADMAAEGLNIADFRANLSALVEGLHGDNPVVLNVRNKPRAVLLDLTAYREMREAAFALRLLQEAEAAEHEPKETIAEVEAALKANAERRRAARAASEAEAA